MGAGLSFSGTLGARGQEIIIRVDHLQEGDMMVCLSYGEGVIPGFK